jgi:hypothetical protein
MKREQSFELVLASIVLVVAQLGDVIQLVVHQHSHLQNILTLAMIVSEWQLVARLLVLLRKQS